MKKINEVHVPHNTGWAGELKQDQVIRISATTTVDFVCLRRQNLRERFDQARTKVYNMKLFITTGDKLMGRNNQHMMTILADGFKEGTHDLQKGMCSGYRFQLAKLELRAEIDLLVALSACPDLPVGGQPVDVLIYEP